MVEKVLRKLEKFLIHNANRVCVSRKWPLLPVATQKRIKDASVLVFDGSKSLGQRPKFSSASRVIILSYFCKIRKFSEFHQ